MEAAQSKANSADKDRRRLLAEVEDVSVEAEKVGLQYSYVAKGCESYINYEGSHGKFGNHIAI